GHVAHRRRLAVARRRRLVRAQGWQDQGSDDRGQRRDRKSHAHENRGDGAEQCGAGRSNLAPRRRCGGRGSGDSLRRPRLGALQTRAVAGLPAPRRASGVGRRRGVGAPMSEVGRELPRLEARAKVTGRAEYTHNLRLPGMLYGKVFRSTVPHGRIRRVDTAAARALDGVHRVVTGEDIHKVIPEPYYGPAFHDQPILALDKVHHVGEPVAVVLAADPHVAEHAVQLIAAVYDEVAAMQPDIVVHDVLKPAGTFADLKHLKGRTGTNVALDYHLRRGDP